MKKFVVVLQRSYSLSKVLYGGTFDPFSQYAAYVKAVDKYKAAKAARAEVAAADQEDLRHMAGAKDYDVSDADYRVLYIFKGHPECLYYGCQTSPINPLD